MQEPFWRWVTSPSVRPAGRPDATLIVPNLLIGEYPTPDDAEWLRRTHGKAIDDASFSRALYLMSQPAVIERARSHAGAQIAIARTLVAQIASSPFRESLALLIEDQIDRAS